MEFSSLVYWGIPNTTGSLSPPRLPRRGVPPSTRNPQRKSPGQSAKRKAQSSAHRAVLESPAHSQYGRGAICGVSARCQVWVPFNRVRCRDSHGLAGRTKESLHWPNSLQVWARCLLQTSEAPWFSCSPGTAISGTQCCRLPGTPPQSSPHLSLCFPPLAGFPLNHLVPARFDWGHLPSPPLAGPDPINTCHMPLLGPAPISPNNDIFQK